MARGLPSKSKMCALLAIFLLWGGLMAGQAQRRFGVLWRSRGASTPVERRLTLPTAETQGSLRMGIFLGERKVGDLNQHWRREGDELSVDALMAVSLDAFLGLAPMPDSDALDESLDVFVESSSKLVGRRLDRLSVAARVGFFQEPFAAISGRGKGDRLEMSIQRGDRTDTTDVPLSPEAGVDLACFPLVALPRLEPGMQWPVAAFDPMTMRVQNVVARVVGQEEIPGGNGEQAFVIRFGGGRRGCRRRGGATVWAAEDGEILQKSVMGLTFVREDAVPSMLSLANAESAR